jgi:predicted HAD superfamily Cof-like phosphohydrolase
VKSAFADVLAFMTIAGQPVRVKPEIPLNSDELAANVAIRNSGSMLDGLVQQLKTHTGSEKAFRLRLILSEAAELAAALADDDMVEVADALADLDYVTIGTAVQFGLPHGAVWDAVQASNMRKFHSCTTCEGEGSVRRTDLRKERVRVEPFGATWLVSLQDGQGLITPEFLLEEEADAFMAKQKWTCVTCKGFGQVAIKDAQGKVQKPGGWSPPDIAAVFAKYTPAG